MSVDSTETTRHSPLQVHHSVLDLIEAKFDGLMLVSHQSFLPNLQPAFVLLLQTLQVVKCGLANSLESHVDVVS